MGQAFLNSGSRVTADTGDKDRAVHSPRGLSIRYAKQVGSLRVPVIAGRMKNPLTDRRITEYA